MFLTYFNSNFIFIFTTCSIYYPRPGDDIIISMILYVHQSVACLLWQISTTTNLRSLLLFCPSSYHDTVIKCTDVHHKQTKDRKPQ